LAGLKALGLNDKMIRSRRKVGERECTIPLDLTVRVTPMLSAVAVIVAPGITAPVVSCTDPRIVPDVTWALICDEHPNTTRVRTTNAWMMLREILRAIERLWNKTPVLLISVLF
jgi:hypothetical protein